MSQTVTVQCPWCHEQIEIWIDPQTTGQIVRDCEVCCRPWDLVVRRDGAGRPSVVVRRGN